MTDENLWISLAKKYLSSDEIQNAISSDDKKRFLNLIKQRLFDDAWTRMEYFGETKPPFIESINSKFLQFDRKISIIETDQINYAKLDAIENGFILKINKSKNETQKRTLIAHEVGHTFLYDVDEIPIKPIFSRDRVSDYFEKDRHSLYSKEEAFVYEIARHILVPSNLLEKDLSLTPSLDMFLESCGKNHFHVSKDLMAKRLYWDTHNWDEELNYWPQSILLLYPISKLSNNRPIPPAGNSEIFKGKDKKFKKIDVKLKMWNSFIPVLHLATTSPNRTIISKNLDLQPGFKDIKIDGMNLFFEMRYSSIDQRIYILILPQEKEKKKKDLSDFMNLC
jgi:hypothetical protein